MRLIVFLFAILLLGSCSVNQKLSGRFEGGYYDLRFFKSDSFLFYNKLEGGISEYAKGKYIIQGKKIILNNKEVNLNEISVHLAQSKNDHEGFGILVNFDTPKSLDGESIIKANLLVNGKKYLSWLNGDSLFLNENIHSVQVKSYISGGIFAGIPTIDTLYSKIITFNEPNNFLSLNFYIDPEYFYSIRLNDSVKVLSKRKIFFRNWVLKKIKDE